MRDAQVENKASAASQSLNHWVLMASVVERQPLRLTPAGIPVCDCVLEHGSTQIEAGDLRQVTTRVRAIAMGVMAERLDRQELGRAARFEGFLATPARGRRHDASSAPARPTLVFHIQDMTLLATTPSL